MKAKELLGILSKLTEEQLELDIRVLDQEGDDDINLWVHTIEVSERGSSGYEVGGEIRLIASE